MTFQIIFQFVSAYEPNHLIHGPHLMKHGDGVKDVAFNVEDLDAIFKRAKQKGAKVIREIKDEKDHMGSVRMATIQTVSSPQILYQNLSLIV